MEQQPQNTPQSPQTTDKTDIAVRDDLPDFGKMLEMPNARQSKEEMKSTKN